MSYYFLEEPIPLKPQAEPIPFPIEALPSTIRDIVRYTADAKQVHPDMPAVIALSAIAACAQGKARISITPEWREELNIYSILVADSGSRKSMVFDALTAPINDYVEKYNKNHSAEILAYQNKLNKLEAKKANLISSFADDTKIDKIQEQILTLTENPKIPLRLIAKDCTPEALAVIMASNQGKTAIMSDEGVFDIMAGLYTGGRSNINIYLNAYDGQPIFIDRKSIGSILINRPLITFGICCQPSVISDFITDKQFIGKGLAQRFIFSEPPEATSARSIYTGEPDTAIKNAYSNAIGRIIALPESLDCIKLSEAAFGLFNSFYEQNELRILQEGKYSVTKTFLNKLPGKAARICGLLHLCEHSKYEPVSAVTMQGALQIAQYFQIQNDRILNISSDYTVAEYVADRLIHNARKDNYSSYRARDIKRFCQKYKGKQIDEALIILQEHRYVQFEPDDKKNPNRQYGVYSLNPMLLYDRQGAVKPLSS